ncbi:MAG TPA: hypothetical protein ENK31_06515, partial [Nannocystis exedens]|nr:hypothetical protein [Nannocystis exedens]
MLLQLAVENFRSFRDRVEFSMRTVDSEPHSGPRARLSEGLHVLKCSAIYGANASGKSNLIKALVFAKSLVTRGVSSKNSKIRVESFRLATSSPREPTSFEFYIYSGGRIYAYSFSLFDSRIIAEKLMVSDSATFEKEELLFERSKDGYTFSPTCLESEPKAGFTDFVAGGTRDNQLFVQEAHERSLPFIEPLYRWFEDTLTIIQPDAEFRWLPRLADSNRDFRAYLQRVLGWADTGIIEVNTERRVLDARLQEEVDTLLADPKTRAIIESMRHRGAGPTVVEN